MKNLLLLIFPCFFGQNTFTKSSAKEYLEQCSKAPSSDNCGNISFRDSDDCDFRKQAEACKALKICRD